ncbi:uncharacterized protein LY89DRAFT_452679 [Mollisia scopiformis]|uniref:Uncharacterized protein n=1 Tax=Mollisia scopiformis TaxID=149040 RepID=A0A194XKN2_MOLSC|nr:uncharacterized protein LY89DRAFT_452679 [Mollisia scopiformis]KUJ20701.1 hypothetical protein LY89DRAFT_452679 [Mollisia scopiformis]
MGGGPVGGGRRGCGSKKGQPRMKEEVRKGSGVLVARGRKQSLEIRPSQAKEYSSAVSRRDGDGRRKPVEATYETRRWRGEGGGRGTRTPGEKRPWLGLALAPGPGCEERFGGAVCFRVQAPCRSVFLACVRRRQQMMIPVSHQLCPSIFPVWAVQYCTVVSLPHPIHLTNHFSGTVEHRCANPP